MTPLPDVIARSRCSKPSIPAHRSVGTARPTEDEVVQHAAFGVGQHAACEFGRSIAGNGGAMRSQHAASHNFHALLNAKPEQRTKAINELRKAQSGQKPKGVKI